MKKLYTLLAIMVCITGLASAQCVIDSSNTDFFNPRPDTLPCVERTVDYNQVIQIKIPSTLNIRDFIPSIPIDYYLTVDSVVIDSVTGFPAGLTDSINPVNGHMYGGHNYCAVLLGNTSADTGNYQLLFHGTMTMHGNPVPIYFPSGDTTISFDDIQSNPQNPFKASLTVINPGDPCRAPQTTGVNDFNSQLNAAIRVYPNPSSGVFDLQINTGGRLAGEVVITDVTGRRVYNQPIDIMGLYSSQINLNQFSKGLYTLQIRTANGVASKNISIE